MPKEVRDLIGQMSEANPLWGAPRIHGELIKLGIEISQAAVSRYMTRRWKPPSQTWRTFLDYYAKEIVSIDFFTVPAATRLVVVWAKGRFPPEWCQVTRCREEVSLIAAASMSGFDADHRGRRAGWVLRKARGA